MSMLHTEILNYNYVMYTIGLIKDCLTCRIFVRNNSGEMFGLFFYYSR